MSSICSTFFLDYCCVLSVSLNIIFVAFTSFCLAGDTEGKTKMAFAKMQTPQSLRESYLLTDADFETIREGEDASIGLEPDVEEV